MAWTKEKQRAAERAWKDQNSRQFKTQLNIVNDADVLARLDAQPNRTDYIRRLIREDIAREKGEQS